MERAYYTLCVFDAESGQWFDEFGSYSKAECTNEKECYDVPARFMKVIKSDGTAADMIAKRDALAIPASRKGGK